MYLKLQKSTELNNFFLYNITCFCAGAHHGEDFLVHAVRQDLQGAAHPPAPPQDPQLRVPGAVLRLQEGLQNKMAGEQSWPNLPPATFDSYTLG